MIWLVNKNFKTSSYKIRSHLCLPYISPRPFCQKQIRVLVLLILTVHVVQCTDANLSTLYKNSLLQIFSWLACWNFVSDKIYLIEFSGVGGSVELGPVVQSVKELQWEQDKTEGVHIEWRKCWTTFAVNPSFEILFYIHEIKVLELDQKNELINSINLFF